MVDKYSGIAQAIIILAEAVRSLKDDGKDTSQVLDTLKQELTLKLADKANKTHTHELSEIVGLIDALANKADKSQLTKLTTLEQVKALIAQAELDDLTLEQVQQEIIKAVADKAATDAVKAKDDEHDREIQALKSGKANTTHTHTWSQITHVPNASTTTKGVVQLNDSVTSTSQTQALTAMQGKVLNDKITRLENKSVDLSGYATKADLENKADKQAFSQAREEIDHLVQDFTMLLGEVDRIDGRFENFKPQEVLDKLADFQEIADYFNEEFRVLKTKVSRLEGD